VKEEIRIALDCMGGDNAPKIVIEGANIIASKQNDIHFLLYGDSSEIDLTLNNFPS